MGIPLVEVAADSVGGRIGNRKGKAGGGVGLVTVWGGVAAFVLLSLGLFGIWRNLGSRTDKLGVIA